MANLKKIREQVLPLSVKFGGETVNFKYRIGRMDSDWENRMRDAQNSGDFARVLEVLFEIVADWNVEDYYVDDPSEERGYRLARDGEEGELRKVALIPEEVEAAGVPTYLIGAIIAKFQEDASTGGSQAKKR